MVLRLREVPPRPAQFDGALCLFDLDADADEAAVRTALGGFGTIVSCNLQGRYKTVRFALHENALALRANVVALTAECSTSTEAAAAIADALGLRFAAVDTLYNERPYEERGWYRSAAALIKTSWRHTSSVHALPVSHT